MSPKYEEDLSSALGAICEVLTRENHLLFVGEDTGIRQGRRPALCRAA